MSRIPESELDDHPDAALKQLAEAVEPFSELVDKGEDYAMFVLGCRDAPTEDDEVLTYINLGGKQGVLAEGLYAELAYQIESGDLSLYTILANVIHDLQESYEIESRGPSSDDEDGPTIVAVDDEDGEIEVTHDVPKTFH